MAHVVLQRRLLFVCAMVPVQNNSQIVLTTTTKEGYPLYRRRDNSRTVEVAGMKLDNRWVVPYNPYLLLKYNAHINVEICSTVSAVKYLYKYVYKGHDRVSVE